MTHPSQPRSGLVLVGAEVSGPSGKVAATLEAGRRRAVARLQEAPDARLDRMLRDGPAVVIDAEDLRVGRKRPVAKSPGLL